MVGQNHREGWIEDRLVFPPHDSAINPRIPNSRVMDRTLARAG
jgi:hypothetical protein